MKIQIKNCFDDSVIFEGEFENLAEAVVQAVSKSANLGGADLRGANLEGVKNIPNTTQVEKDASPTNYSRDTMLQIITDQITDLSDEALAKIASIVLGQEVTVEPVTFIVK